MKAEAIAPGAWLGLLGGGQLGRMFTMAAQSMGYRVAVLDPFAHSPAGAVADRHIRAECTDQAALDELAGIVRAVTTEFENVPARSIAYLARRCRVSPSADAVEIAQDRIREKEFVQSCGIAVVPWARVTAVADLESAPAELFPGLLKLSRLGYDGKGQEQVGSREEALAAFDRFERRPCVLEKLMPLEREVSIIVARRGPGDLVNFPVVENAHARGILDTSIAPARVSRELGARAAHAAERLAERLDYVGVLCVEFFVLPKGGLSVNEIAPRPHNSGHYTIDACVTSQFEQQARILAGFPLGSTAQHCPAVMVNLLGELWHAGEPDWTRLLGRPEVKLHLYGKDGARTGRKMGHYTVLAGHVETAIEAARAIRAELGF